MQGCPRAVLFFSEKQKIFPCLYLVHKVLILYNETLDERQVQTGMYRRNRFFRGRNGSDALSMTSSIIACLLLLVDMLAGSDNSPLWFLALGFLCYSYFRIFSRNVTRRQTENQWFLRKLSPLMNLRARRAERKRQKNLYCFFKCPQCATVLRVPQGKGRIRITCRCCQHVFERIS